MHCALVFDNKKYCVKKYCASICVHLFLATKVADATLLPCSFRGRLNRVITSLQCIKKANSRLRIFRFLFKIILISMMNIINHGYSQWTVILVTFSTPASTELSAWNFFCHLDIFMFTLIFANFSSSLLVQICVTSTYEAFHFQLHSLCCIWSQNHLLVLKNKTAIFLFAPQENLSSWIG